MVSKPTIARWVKTTLQNVGIDVAMFTPHSTRAASTSKVDTSVFLDDQVLPTYMASPTYI